MIPSDPGLDASAAAVGLLVAAGVGALVFFLTGQTRMARNGAPRRRAHMKRNGKRVTKAERAIRAEEDRVGATDLQKRFNAGEFDGTERSYREAETALVGLYDLAREGVRLASTKRAAPKNYRTLTWTTKGKSAFLHGKDGVPLASISQSGDFTWKAYVVHADGDAYLGDFLSREGAERAAGKEALSEAQRRRKDVSLVPTRAIEDHYERPAPPLLRLGQMLELRRKR